MCDGNQSQFFRSEYVWEEFTFLPGFLRDYRSNKFDITVSCSFPFLNWLLRALRRKKSPAHIFVTQNGDYAPSTRKREYRFFGCDGLVCTNSDDYERNQTRCFCKLIPHGVNPEVFHPVPAQRLLLSLPENVTLALMVSALIPSKRVENGIRAISKIPNFHLLVCGDGPRREHIQQQGKKSVRQSLPS
ncbi:MAG: hypothetical protein N2035_00125 [Chthoniobacterales bacterium]|nr:hypothetical protein [Chthoniobacterales bacterium]